MKDSFSLAGLKIDAAEYGSQGSAVLGIRDSGKTYTATVLAEKLFDSGIPFIAFDPIGVWRYLRVPGKGRGYPVVVAGGQEKDLPLTVASAPEIVRASMLNGVSLVIDLFDINLSKADWKRIVTACVRVLLHENAKYGLRHIFIEEAAEFAPQRVGPDQGQVYAEIEKLARMGGNARLGYTLINQRAEEVNKAVLELCDNLFLHRQKGRNSLTALSKWLDIGNVKESKSIIDSLSTLPTGECWAWMAGSETPVLIKVPEKNSLHPDRRTMRGAKDIKAKAAVDVGSFVKTMRETLTNIEVEAAANDPAKLKAKIKELEKALSTGSNSPVNPEALRKEFTRGKVEGYSEGYSQCADDHSMAFSAAQGTLASSVHRFVNDFKFPKFNIKKSLANSKAKKVEIARPLKWPDHQTAPGIKQSSVGWSEKPKPDQIVGGFVKEGTLTRPQKRIMDSLLFWDSVGQQTPTRDQVAAVAGYSVGGGSFQNTLSQLRVMGLVTSVGAGEVKAEKWPVGIERMTSDQARNQLLSILGGPHKRIFQALSGSEQMTREKVAELSGYELSGGSFQNTLSRLCVIGLVVKPATGMLALSDWAAELFTA